MMRGTSASGALLALALAAHAARAAGHVRLSAAHHNLRVGEGTISDSNASAWRFPEEPRLSYFEDLLNRVVNKATIAVARLEGRSLARDSFDIPSPFADKWHEGNLECGVTHKASYLSDKWDRCPSQCPLFAKHEVDGDFCNFLCVGNSNEHCSMINPKEPVADLERGICRSCWISGCQTCETGLDKCAKCSEGFELQADGTCSNNYWIGWAILFSCLGLLVVLIIAWMIDLSRRPIVNEEGLKWGLTTRSQAKLHMPKEEHIILDETVPGGERRVVKRGLWPITTNLLRQQVAGPGILLQFNFQLILILWGAAVAIAWTATSYATDTELMALGTHEANTPRQNCIIVAFGYRKQQELMEVKVIFTIGLYVFSLLMALLHGVRQLRMFQTMDADNTTHKDFAIRVSGLPILKGDVLVEKELSQLMAETTGKVVVGSSVGWDYMENEEKCLAQLEDYLKERENDIDTSKPKTKSDLELAEEQLAEEEQINAELSHAFSSAHQTNESTAQVLKEEAAVVAQKSGYLFRKFESFFMHPSTQKLLTRGGSKIRKKFHEEDDMIVDGFRKAATGASQKAKQMKETVLRLTPRGGVSSEVPAAIPEESPRMSDGGEEEEKFDMDTYLREMDSTTEAYVVFETEFARDEAIKVFKHKGGVEYRGSTLEAEVATCEPDTVLWANLAVDDFGEKAQRVVMGLLVICLALLAWAVCFYLPYAYFIVFATNFDGGDEPSAISGITFSMVVVAGNALMYLVCSEVADRTGLHSVDDREVLYMLLYAFACTSNVVLDLATTYCMAYEMMVGKDMRTYDGRHLREVKHFTTRFETYAMQRALGEQLMAYSFPATFLIPFIIEPIATIWMPYKVMCMLIRSHKDVTPDEAEGYLGSLVMDLSRYADLLLNVMLAVLVFFFPGGFVLKMFWGFVLSHCWIYVVDHYRVLKVVRKCNYAAMRVDWWAQWMLCIPLGLLASAMVFKANCTEDVMGYGTPPLFCLNGVPLVAAMVGAFVGHCVLHTVLLLTVVPLMGKAEVPPTQDTYQECAESLASSFFTANPINCLRSKHVYKHEVPCDFALVGKEHLIRKNAAIGQFFEDEKAESEDYLRYENMSLASAREHMSSFHREISKAVRSTSAESSLDPSSPSGSQKKKEAEESIAEEA